MLKTIWQQYDAQCLTFCCNSVIGKATGQYTSAVKKKLYKNSKQIAIGIKCISKLTNYIYIYIYLFKQAKMAGSMIKSLVCICLIHSCWAFWSKSSPIKSTSITSKLNLIQTHIQLSPTRTKNSKNKKTFSHANNELVYIVNIEIQHTDTYITNNLHNKYCINVIHTNWSDKY